MNESILFNISPSEDILANATALQIDGSPFYNIEILLVLIFSLLLLWFSLWFYFRFRSKL